MRRILTFLMAVFVITIGSQAQAADLLIDWTLDTTGIGGTAVVNHINSIGMNGTLNLVQNIADNSGVVKVGDTFTISPVSPATALTFTGVSYNNNLNQTIAPLLGANQGVLSLQSSVNLTGSVIQSLGTNIYRFQFNNPGATAITLDYLDPTSVNHVIATFDLTPSESTGLSTDTNVGSTGLLQGTSTLSGVMHVLLPGVLFDSLGNDLADGPYAAKVGALGSGFNYAAKFASNQIVADGVSTNSNFTIGVIVPEPSTLLLLGGGIIGAALIRRRGRRA